MIFFFKFKRVNENKTVKESNAFGAVNEQKTNKNVSLYYLTNGKWNKQQQARLKFSRPEESRGERE
jgi:hypothetical protein